MKKRTTMLASVFREYDIRGKVGQEFDLNEVYNLISSCAVYFNTLSLKSRIIAIGMDGRNHSSSIKSEVCRALTDAGFDIEFIGICPSPALYFALHTRSYGAGIMITASHNPKEYNGFKICVGTQSLWGGAVRELGRLYDQRVSYHAEVPGHYTENNIILAYVQWLAQEFSHLKGASISALIDCGNGVGGSVMPLLKEHMQWKSVYLLYHEVDGDYPHHEADPVVLENMADLQKIILNSDFDIGIGLDGDGDRMAALTKKGRLLAGDILLAIFASDMTEDYGPIKVVCDIKSSQAVISFLESLGIEVFMSPCGHAIIKENMKKRGALIGGELSCHFVFNDRYFGYDDGIYAMMRLFELLIKKKTTLDALADCIPQTYASSEIRIICQEDEKKTFVEKVHAYFLKTHANARFITIEGVRIVLDYGWGLVRAANTQPAISLRLESSTSEGLERLKIEFIQALGDSLTSDQQKNILRA